MAPLEPSDWELINAYADDELPAEDRRAVERRLAGDGAFAAALHEVRSLKANLQALKPAAVQPHPGLARQRQLVRPVPMGGAAAAVAAALFAMAQLLPPSTAADWDEVTSNLHAQFSGNAYVLAPANPVVAVSTGRMGDLAAFDLSDSRLTLVDARNVQVSGSTIVAMHYRGPSGCSLTITVAAESALKHVSAARSSGALQAHWTTRGNHFHVVASGMDKNRFEAIAAYVRAETLHQGGGKEMRIALRSATDHARPCA
jgi:anti-sigma factor RsiW